MQTDRKLWKNPYDGFAETFDPRKMGGNFTVEHTLLIGMASFTRHGQYSQ